ncbi:MAG: hypothetical protein RMA76_35290 [Deltaproteobacteria bacterium]
MTRFSRREVMQVLGLLGLGAACGVRTEEPPPGKFDALDPENYTYREVEELTQAEATLRVAFDVLLPSERDASGSVVSPGANDVDTLAMLALANFVPAARELNLLPVLPAVLDRTPEAFDDAVRLVLAADLDALAFDQRPFTAFRRLPRDLQEAAIDEGFEDPERAVGLTFLRAACFLAWLGGGESKAGLVAIGFPPFEDPAANIAIRGYPRTTDGRLVDAETEDLGALAAAGVLDDYTFNRTPAPTPGEDLATLLDANGDLL